MAILVPESPRFRSKGERALAELLKNLPDDCVVYHEPRYHRACPDFVIVSPRIGLLVLEAKGWHAGNIQKADRKEITTNYQGTTQKHQHPFEQARDYMFNLKDFLKGHFGVNGFRFSLEYAVIFSQMRRDQIEGANLLRIFPQSETIYADIFEQWKKITDGKALEKELSAYSSKEHFPKPPLSPAEMEGIRDAINPSRTFTKPTPSVVYLGEAQESQELIHHLDLKQESAATSLGGGHRILPGVAGSGKTIVLQARARYLAASRPESKILLLCYNRTLAAWLRHQLAGFEKNVEVANFHAFASKRSVKWNYGTKDETLGKRLLSKLQESPPEYDAVLIDEGQDFVASWFQCAVAALKDPEKSDLVIAIDGAQGLYKRLGFTWASVGIRAQGRNEAKRLGLYHNYRNTRAIVRAAARIIESPVDSEGQESEIALTVDPENAIIPGGLPPAIWASNDRSEEARWVYRTVRDALKGKWGNHSVEPLRPEEIGILYPPIPSKENGGEELQKWLGKLIKNLGDLTPTVWLNRNSSARDRVNEPGVKVQTIHSAKGLQYRAVIILWSDLLPTDGGDAIRETRDRRLLYVALTRAESLLALTQSRPSRFLDEITEADLEKSLALAR
ncbi:NERD domain-containing protein [Verrucomicrobiales bacterium]|nr:NERD domain-containing protein [Verrucomicrobiales bacterium]